MYATDLALPILPVNKRALGTEITAKSVESKAQLLVLPSDKRQKNPFLIHVNTPYSKRIYELLSSEI